MLPYFIELSQETLHETLQNFLSILNTQFKEGGLTMSITHAEWLELIMDLQRTYLRECMMTGGKKKKEAVQYVGLQKNGEIIVSSDCMFAADDDERR